MAEKRAYIMFVQFEVKHRSIEISDINNVGGHGKVGIVKVFVVAQENEGGRGLLWVVCGGGVAMVVILLNGWVYVKDCGSM